MAFLSRSSRNTALVKDTATTPRVGPGAYNIPRLLESSCDRINYVPFGSGSGRPIYDYSSDVPAPGSYIEPLQSQQIERASWNAFKSSTPRFPDRVDEHQAKCPVGIGHTPWNTKRSSRNIKRPVWMQKPAQAPVIPSIPANSFGYVMTADGTLQPRPPPLPKSTPSGESGTLTSRGTVFGRSAERWREKTENAGPGPGQYNPIDREKMMFDKGKFSRMSSSFAAQTQREGSSTATGPGPGQYDIPGQFRKPACASKCQNFGSKTRRWAESFDPDEISPGPGSYNPDRRPQYIRLRPPPVPFNSLSERFPEHEPDTQPGPQNYDLPSSIRRPRSKSNAPFGSRRERFQQPQTETQPSQPSSARDDHSQHQVCRRKARLVPAWRSADRVHKPAKSVETETGPAPGSYDVDKVTTAFQPRRYKAKGYQFAPRTKPPPHREQTLVPLLERLNDRTFSLASTSRSPRPSPRRKIVLGTSSFLSHVDRFAGDPTVAMRNQNPGPGEYGDLRPSMLKRTFNITIHPEFDQIPSEDYNTT